MFNNVRKFAIGDRIIHSNRYEWGIGEILLIERNFVHIRFSEVGRKKLQYSLTSTWHLESVTKQLKKEVEAKIIIHRHKEFITMKNGVYKGIKINSSARRSTHCYNCKESISSETHLECNSCGWIICNCGACGCGYQ